MSDAAAHLAPREAIPASLLSQIQQDWRRQEYDRAATRMEAHWQASPREPVRLLHYATILGHCSRFQSARSLLDALIDQSEPARRLWALGSAGVASCDFQRFDWAAEYLALAARETSPPPAVFHRWSEALERLSRLREAREALEEGRSRFPTHPGLAFMSARLTRREGDDEQAEREARDVLAMPTASLEIRCQAGYELGHALDAQDRCNEAYEAFIAAKAVQASQAATFEPMWRARIAHLRSANDLPSTEEFRRRADDAPNAPRPHAFLVGCARSGTTLLERMLGSHAQVASSSESAVWHSAVWMPFLRECSDTSSMRAVLASLTPERAHASRERYWKAIAETIDDGIGGRLLLDKNPSIFAMLAGAACLFPRASALVALRDPRDVVWSSFTQYLPMNAGTAAFLQLESTAEQVAAELEGWLHLRPRLATPWLEVRYEAVVNDPHSELRRVLAFLGLPWTDTVLDFHRRTDRVGSPTYAAVREPVHDRAIGRWRRYAALMQPAERTLEKAIRELA